MTLEELERVARGRRTATPAESYTATLLGDSELAQRKIMEEAFELCLEIGRPESDPERTAAEAADLLYHVVVGLVSVDVSVDEVFAVLEARRA